MVWVRLRVCGWSRLRDKPFGFVMEVGWLGPELPSGGRGCVFDRGGVLGRRLRIGPRHTLPRMGPTGRYRLLAWCRVCPGR